MPTTSVWGTRRSRWTTSSIGGTLRRSVRCTGGAALRRRALRAHRRAGRSGGIVMTPLATEARPKAADPDDVTAERLSKDELQKIDAYWRACTYLAAGMIYLRSTPLLREPLKSEHVKQRLLGHWGTSPGMSFTYVHLNRLINKYDLDAIFLAGPGHG